MFQDAYTKLNADEASALVETLNPLFDGGRFHPGSTVVMMRALSFYKGYRFLDIADHKHMPANRRFVLQSDVLKSDRAANDTIVLDFTNAPIYELNARAPIALNKETVIDYARFFFSFVRGRHGRFLIVETVDDIPWREEPPPAARKAVGKMILPIALTGKGLDGAYQLSAQMLFKDSLFNADISIAANGFVKISNERLLVEDMPVLDDTLGQ